MASYIPGYINTYDVAGLGQTTMNAMYGQKMHQTLDVHEGVICDGCGISPLRGIRWKCQCCPDHDVCTQCKSRPEAAGHAFQQMSLTSTQNQMAVATGVGRIEPEAAVHWVACKHCNMYPIRGQLFCCVVCTPDYNLCESCNNTRRANPDSHPHRFDFFYMPRAQNPPPTQPDGVISQAAGNIVPTQASNQPTPLANCYQQIQVLPQTGNFNQPIVLLVHQDVANTSLVQQQLSPEPTPEPYEPPPPPDHSWSPRGGYSDEYYQHTQYAMAGGHCNVTDHQHYPIAVAKATYMAAADDELSFPEGAQVLVTKFCNRSWWRGEWKGLGGLFPCQLVELEITENVTTLT